MRSRIILINILLNLFSFTNQCIVAHPSLFFKDQEVNHKNNNLEHTSNSENLKLRAILFLSDHQWSIWVENFVIHPENMDDITEFQIEKVTESSVTLSKREQEGEMIKSVTLSP